MAAFLDVTVGMFCLVIISPLILIFSIIAMYYLESRKLVHRDISYTNILLRIPGKDGAAKKAKQSEIICELDLSDVEKLWTELGCREGLRIDFDYTSFLAETDEATVVEEAVGNLDKNRRKSR